MSSEIVVQYVGFESKDFFREYTFAVHEKGVESREYRLMIANEAFVAHRARYQDGPNICSLKLHREFAAHANHPPSVTFCVMDEELADYQNAHRPKSSATPYRPSED